MKKLILLVVFFSFSTSFYISAQSKKAQKEGFDATHKSIKSIVNSKHYQYVGHSVYNSEGRKMLDTDSNQLEINRKKVNGTLNSLDSFVYDTKTTNSKISNYKIILNDDKQTVVIQFNIEKDKFRIEVKPNGKAFLTLNSGINNISQTGMIKRI